MTTPRGNGVDPQLVARLSGQFLTLGEHLRQVSGDLNALHTQLVVQPAQQVPARPQPMPQPVPQARPTPQPQPVPQPQFQPRPSPSVAAYTSRPTPSPKEPWWQRDGVISRLLAVAGAGVTLIGVVMLLVLAAQAGWFGPELRVGAGAVLSVGLIAVGARVFGRPGGRVGGIAVAATGIAGLYLDVVAVTSIYGWLHPVLGLSVAFGIAAAGVALAVSWRSQPMAALILVGVTVCAPVVTDGLSLPLIAFFTVMLLAGFPAQLGRDWPILNLVRTVPVVVVLLIGIARGVTWSLSWENAVQLLVAAAIVFAFGLGSSVELLRRNVADAMASAMIGVVAVPMLAVGALFAPWTHTLVEAVVALMCVVTIALAHWLPTLTRLVLGTVGAIALLQAVLVPTSADLRPAALLVVAAGMIAAAWQMSSKATYWFGAAFAALGALGFLVVAPPDALMDSDYAAGDIGVVIAGVLLTAAMIGLVLVARHLSIANNNLEACWVLAGIVSLYAMTSATVSLGVAALGVAALGGSEGFVAGHCAATIEWMAIAMALLALGLRSEKYAHTALLAGLSLTAAAVAKLFLFDLVALDGLFRVSAFIVVGLLLLFAGTRYAKVFAER
ncbi:DUF2339 domain-containing protein [Rhodococcoides kyotonense]|uniref:Predicted membrane protein n=1 Tax=Rhodococcoides kyotonense TaxID=398843 RepID=A0A239JC77_9NOCA|nr:DUF2339 domain-containing protein [Rhodococcus kyotonensis]SNT03409.1 Predicted membrane protein [Rhodococcus kyotonensis]